MKLDARGAYLRLLLALARDDARDVDALAAIAAELGAPEALDLARVPLDLAELCARVVDPTLTARLADDLSSLALAGGRERLELAAAREIARQLRVEPPPDAAWRAVDPPADLEARLRAREAHRDGRPAPIERDEVEAALRALRALRVAPPARGLPRSLWSEALRGDEWLVAGCTGAAFGLLSLSTRLMATKLLDAGPAARAAGVVALVFAALFVAPFAWAALRTLGRALGGERRGALRPALVLRAHEEALPAGAVEHHELLFEQDGRARFASVSRPRGASQLRGPREGEQVWVLVPDGRPLDAQPVDPARERHGGVLVGELPETSPPPVSGGPRASLLARVDARRRELAAASVVRRAVDVQGFARGAPVAVVLQPAQRCPFCMDAIGDASPSSLTACDACGAVLHHACHAESPGCPTPGCRRGARRDLRVTEPGR